MRRYASYGPVCLSLWVRLSFTSWSSVEVAGWIQLVFGVGASLCISCTVLKENLAISKNKGTSLGNFVPNSGLRKFHFGISVVKTCCQLGSTKVDAQSVINWTVIGQLSLQYLTKLWRSTISLPQGSSSSVYSTISLHGFISDSWYLF